MSIKKVMGSNMRTQAHVTQNLLEVRHQNRTDDEKALTTEQLFL